jgi:hypothetical protein
MNITWICKECEVPCTLKSNYISKQKNKPTKCPLGMPWSCLWEKKEEND